MSKTKAKTGMNNFGKLGWAVVIYTLLIYLFTCVTNDTLNVTVEVFAGVLGVTNNDLLPMAAVGGFVGVVLSLIVGAIIAKKNVKMPTAILFVVLGILFAINGQARSLPVYAIAAVLSTAVAQTLNLVCTQQIMSNWFPKKKGIALGWATMGMPICSAVMVAVFQGLFGVSIAAPYWLMLVICLIMAAITLFWFKNYPEEAGAYPDNQPVDEEEQKKTLEFMNSYKSPWTIGKLLKTKEFWMLVLIFGFLFMGLVATMIISAFGMAVASVPVTILSIVLYSLLNGGLGNRMPSMFISVFGRFDFAQANKLGMPIVICLRSLTMIIMPIILTANAMAGNAEAVGYRNLFIVISVLSVIAAVLAFLIKDKTIGTEKN